MTCGSDAAQSSAGGTAPTASCPWLPPSNDVQVPALERLKRLAIASSNLGAFFTRGAAESTGN
jgi:hypothetical protein